MGFGGSAPAPVLPTSIPAPPPAPMLASTAAAATNVSQSAATAAAMGQSGTILTSPQGVMGNTSTAGKKLIGQ